MLLLEGNQPPADRAALADALRGAVRRLFVLPDGDPAVVVEGDGYPDADLLRIDLSGATVAPQRRSPTPGGGAEARPGPRFRRLEVVAHPLRVEGAAVHADLTAHDVGCQFERDRDGRPWLALASARDGHFAARVSQRDLDAVIQAKVRELAREKGVAVERVECRLAQAGPRAVRLDATVHVVKKTFLTVRGVVTLAGRLDITDELVARLSGLSVAGEGVLVSLAVGLVRDQVQALEGREFPLTAVSLGAIRLRDVQLHVGDDLAVTAAFGA
jgi:hypothetical protein